MGESRGQLVDIDHWKMQEPVSGSSFPVIHKEET